MGRGSSSVKVFLSLIVVAACLLSGLQARGVLVSEEEVQWVKEQDMRESIRRTGKPAWILFSTKNCAPCRAVEKSLGMPEVISATSQFVCVKLSSGLAAIQTEK